MPLGIVGADSNVGESLFSRFQELDAGFLKEAQVNQVLSIAELGRMGRSDDGKFTRRSSEYLHKGLTGLGVARAISFLQDLSLPASRKAGRVGLLIGVGIAGAKQVKDWVDNHPKKVMSTQTVSGPKSMPAIRVFKLLENRLK